MEQRAYRLRMQTPLHVGERGIGLEGTLEHIPSDTLFGALAVTWAGIEGQRTVVENLAAHFAEEPPLLLTSAFPAIGPLLLYPRPLLGIAPSPDGAAQGESGGGKRFKRVRWVSQAVLDALCAAPTQETLDAHWRAAQLLQGGDVWATAAEVEAARAALGAPLEAETSLWGTTRVPRVAVDRRASASTLFHVGRVDFAPGAGLWCMAAGAKEWLDRVDRALTLLADSGIGGQRSRGSGHFVVEPLPAPVVPAWESAYGLLLSRLAPRPDEMSLLRQPRAAYEPVLVGGYVGTPSAPARLRKPLRMLAEGSVIGLAARPPGALVDVTPDDRAGFGHSIYRYGIGVTLPVRFAPGGDA